MEPVLPQQMENITLNSEFQGNVHVPVWFPDDLTEKILAHDGPDKERLIGRIEKTLESGLHTISDEFNRPTFDKFSKLKIEKERSKLLSAIGIEREMLNEYISTSQHLGYQEHPEEALVINERAKKELVAQIWKVTSKAWEMDRPRREKERASHDYSLPHRVSRRMHGLDRVFEKVGGWKQEIMGVRQLNKIADRILAIQPGVEDILREYSVK